MKTLLRGVVALVANAMIEVGKSGIKDYRGAIVALLSLGVMIVYPNIFAVLILAALTGLLLFSREAAMQKYPN